jgi:LPXTG-motif cell wall-anchored protein
MIVIGAVWFFQGIGVAQGSQMSNNTWWAVLGGAIAIGGFVLLYRQNKITKAMIDEEQAEAARAAEATEPDGA